MVGLVIEQEIDMNYRSGGVGIVDALIRGAERRIRAVTPTPVSCPLR
jgi:hypothetical protein